MDRPILKDEERFPWEAYTLVEGGLRRRQGNIGIFLSGMVASVAIILIIVLFISHQ